MMAMSVIRILLAEDMSLLREALAELLDHEGDLAVVARVGSGADIVAQAELHRPDVAVIDIDLPGQEGITAAAALRDRLPACRILILTALSGPGQDRPRSRLDLTRTARPLGTVRRQVGLPSVVLRFALPDSPVLGRLAGQAMGE